VGIQVGCLDGRLLGWLDGSSSREPTWLPRRMSNWLVRRTACWFHCRNSCWLDSRSSCWESAWLPRRMSSRIWNWLPWRF